MALLYAANSKEVIHISRLLAKHQGPSLTLVLQNAHADQSLVSVLAYSLMPNHFHLVLEQLVEDGISSFMRKLSTGYSMYFNTRYEHSGVLFQGRFKSSHIDSESYFRYIFSYVHLNPVELIEPDWKEEGIKDKRQVEKFLSEYQYSSYYDYHVGERAERALIAYDDAPDFLKKKNDIAEMLACLEHENLEENIKDGP
jgi:putative transposase